MTIERPVISLHLLLCVVALIIGVAVFFGGIDVNHQHGFGLVIAIVAILFAL